MAGAEDDVGVYLARESHERETLVFGGGLAEWQHNAVDAAKLAEESEHFV